ncbi:hypothetical protein GW846_01505 [Candidatus Gracilibacteria bacterium]|nr:hypothetical protein [Candidatus Gracilibacteria bacterium]
MNVHTLDQNKYLEVGNILKSKFFLRFFLKYQKSTKCNERKRYKNFPKVGRSSFSDEFYSDIEDIFGDTSKLKHFLQTFREEMISHPEIWDQINTGLSDEEFVNTIMNFMGIYLELGIAEFTIKEICKEKVDQLISAGKETRNDINGLSIPESLQLGREHGLFPIDSEGEIIFFLSKEGGEYNVTQQFSNEIATVKKDGEVLKIHNPEFILFSDDDSREVSLEKMNSLELFLNIYRALHGKLDYEYCVTGDGMENYGDFIDNWIQSLSDKSYDSKEDIFIQQGGKWGNMFEKFLIENIEILRKKTQRASLKIIK